MGSLRGFIMKKLALALGVFLTMGLSVVAAFTLSPSRSLKTSDDSLVQHVDKRCGPGQYFCPGKVAGCCPNGWGCGSTTCTPPTDAKRDTGNLVLLGQQTVGFRVDRD